MTSGRSFLQNILLLDAATCLAMGAMLGLAAPLAGELTNLPAGFLRVVGLALIPVGLFILATARGNPPNRALVWVVVLGNAGWVLASLALLVVDALAPNGLGIAFILAQAVVVAIFAEVEFLNLRREPTARLA